MPSVERDQEERASDDDDSDVEVAPVSAAAYADPSVYRWPQKDDASDFDSAAEEMSFSYDDNEDPSFSPDNEKSSEDEEVSSYYTDVGNEVEILNSPSAATPFDPIDLRVSKDDTEAQESNYQESQPLFSDTSDDEPGARRVLQNPGPVLFWNVRQEQAFFDLRMEDICAFTGRNIPYHGRFRTFL